LLVVVERVAGQSSKERPVPLETTTAYKFVDGDAKRCALWDKVVYTHGLLINDSTPGHSKGALWVSGADVYGHATAWSAWYAADAAATASVTAYELHTFFTTVAEGCVVDKCSVTYHRFAAGQLDGSLSSPKCNADGTATIDCCGKGESIELHIIPQLDPNQGTTTTTTSGTINASGVAPIGSGVSVSGGGSVQVVKTTKETMGGGDAEQLTIISDDMTASCSATVGVTTVVSLHANAYDGGNKHVARMQVDIKNQFQSKTSTIKCDCEEPEHSMAPQPPSDRKEHAARADEQRQQVQRVVDALKHAADTLAARVNLSRNTSVDKVQATLTTRLTDLADTVSTPDQLANVRALQAAIQSAPVDRSEEPGEALLETVEQLRGHAWMLQRLATFAGDGYVHEEAFLERTLAEARALIQPPPGPAGGSSGGSPRRGRPRAARG
jgi:hypothetical protein